MLASAGVPWHPDGMLPTVELADARAALAAAWQVRSLVPAERLERVEAMLRRMGGALDGTVPRLRAAHVLPLDLTAPGEPAPGEPALAAPPEPQTRASAPPQTAEATEALSIVVNALAAGIAHLFRRDVPHEHATLRWLGLLEVRAADALAVVNRAALLLGHTIADADELGAEWPTFRGALEDPYDDALLALVPYLKDQAREEELEDRVGPAEAAMSLGPEPVTGSRDALGLSFSRWRVTEAGIEALVQCRLHALSHEDWVLIVPEAARGRRQLVRAFLFAFREAVSNGPALEGLRHVWPPSPLSLAHLLGRLFSPSVLSELHSGEAVDFEQRLAEPRYLGGVVPELEHLWSVSPFRRVVREAGSVRRAMELVAPTILEVACERYGQDVAVDIDEYEEIFTIRRRAQVATGDRSASGVPNQGLVSTVLETVLTERWQP